MTTLRDRLLGLTEELAGPTIDYSRSLALTAARMALEDAESAAVRGQLIACPPDCGCETGMKPKDARAIGATMAARRIRALRDELA